MLCLISIHPHTPPCSFHLLPPIPNQRDNRGCQWGMIPVPLIPASTPSTAPSAQGKDPWRFPPFARSQGRHLAGSQEPLRIGNGMTRGLWSMTRNQFQTGNVRRGLFSPNLSFFQAARDRSNCCRFFLYICLQRKLARSVGAITLFLRWLEVLF